MSAERDPGERAPEEEPERDPRAAEPPEGEDAEEGESGPLGNPSEDEEALSHRQQDHG